MASKYIIRHINTNLKKNTNCVNRYQGMTEAIKISRQTGHTAQQDTFFRQARHDTRLARPGDEGSKDPHASSTDGQT